MKLSILDQLPVLTNSSNRDAIEASLQLANYGEKLGFTRYWITEHHGTSYLASSAPEVLLAYIGSQSNKIKIGSGATLLPHYKPYKVAEIFHTLSTIYPGRTDLGIGRAPGGSAEAAIALSGNFLENVKNIPKSMDELLHFLSGSFPSGHLYENLEATPVPTIPPDIWLLGTSKKSAKLAAEKGLGYAFGFFMSEEDGQKIIEEYREHFIPSTYFEKPYVILAVSVVCAETDDLAHQIVMEKQTSNFKEKTIVGNPNKVKQTLDALQKQHNADEMMIITHTNSYQSRLRSYELIMKA